MPARLEDQLIAALNVAVPTGLRESVKIRVMTEVDRLIAKKPAPIPKPPRRPWDVLKLRLIALASGMIVMLGAGTAVAAAAAGPDSWLYPVKQDLESVRAGLARGSMAESHYQVDRAGKRLDEIDAMITAGKPEYVPDLLAHYATHMRRAAELRNEALANGENTSQLDEVIAVTQTRHDELLKSLSGDLPDDIRQAIIDEGEDNAVPSPADQQQDEAASADSTTAGGVTGSDDEQINQVPPSPGSAVSHDETGDADGTSGSIGGSSGSSESGDGYGHQGDSNDMPALPESQSAPESQPDNHETHESGSGHEGHAESPSSQPGESGYQMPQPDPAAPPR